MQLKIIIFMVVLFLAVSCASGTNNENKSSGSNPIVISSISIIATIPTSYAKMVVCRGNYAYLYGTTSAGFTTNFVIYDLSNPSSPVRRGYLTNAGFGWGLALNGNYAYLQHNSGGTNLFTNMGNAIVDISDVDNPKEVQNVTNGCANFYQNYYVNGYLYTFSGDIIGIFNMSNPSNFNWVTNISNPSTDDYDWAAFSGNFLFTLNSGKFQVFDISSPAVYSMVSSITCTNTTSGGCAIKGDFAYLGGSQTNVVVVNIANPASPVIMTNYTIDTNLIKSRKIYDLKILGNYLLLASLSNFIVLNIENPTNISYVDSFDLTNGGGWNFDILNNQYAVVADSSCYYVIKLY